MYVDYIMLLDFSGQKSNADTNMFMPMLMASAIEFGRRSKGI